MSVVGFIKKAIKEPLRVGAPAPTSPRTARFMVQVSGMGKGDRVLDAGTGNGVVAVEAAKMGCAVVAIDVDPEMLKLARKRAAEEGVEDSIEFLRADATRLHEVFDANEFDVVLSTVPVTTVEDPVGLLRSYWRVLKPSGTLVQLTHWPRFFRRIVDKSPFTIAERYFRWVHVVPGYVFVCEPEG